MTARRRGMSYSEAGALGGKNGGPARAAKLSQAHGRRGGLTAAKNMTPAARTRRARKAARDRWDEYRRAQIIREAEELTRELQEMTRRFGGVSIP